MHEADLRLGAKAREDLYGFHVSAARELRLPLAFVWISDGSGVDDGRGKDGVEGPRHRVRLREVERYGARALGLSTCCNNAPGPCQTELQALSEKSVSAG